jgi:hypothetical protein
MSGILDNKTRIMDTIVTLEGRRQMAEGKLRIEYVSFTDNSTFYDPDVVSGSADATNRIYFEQCHLPQDQITFEADDSGRLKPFKGQGDNVISGKIFSGSSSNLQFLTGNEFASTANTLIASSINNFNNLQIIGTKDFIFENEGFEANPENLTFNINYLNEKVLSSFTDGFSEKITLESFPSLFNSKWLENSINFKYLPPINKVLNNTTDRSNLSFLEKNKIGNYTKLNNFENPYTSKKIENDLISLEKKGFKKTVFFDPTSMTNNLVSQFFEINDTEVQKLDVIDYGEYVRNGTSKRMFFVGKIKIDEDGSQCFINMFTLVFE